VSLSAEVVESNLLSRLTETINTEITQSVIESADDALVWLKRTFFYVRVKRAPERYGFRIQAEAKLEAKLSDLCSESISQLAKAGIIQVKTNPSDGQITLPEAQETPTTCEGVSGVCSVTALPEAGIMSKYLITFGTMLRLLELPMAASLPEVIDMLSMCEEVGKPVRRTDKKFLNECIKTLRFPLKARVQKPDQKAVVLLQTAIQRIHIPDFALRVEQNEIVDMSVRILSALTEVCLTRNMGE
jgi:ATP-dependent DNA helicase HFM1/MER3